MASGWAADGAENEQIEATINDAITGKTGIATGREPNSL